jgi:5-methylcytosine-specific restriction protein A
VDKHSRYNASRANDPEAVKRKRIYNSGLWKHTRRRKLAHDALCEMCLEDNLIVPAVEVDHIVPLADGGAPYDMANLCSLCTPCHSRKTADERTGKNPLRGCCVHGYPRDPTHPWNKDGMCKECGGGTG